ncbi:hypothetical protein CA984_34560 [Streptosporangium minutum]|uniref:Uncharacterized protein n=1 Tax=Streptosporangium minutum TaxID=569862 RepID=A0A243R9H5_9ACTN|nr:hypothetical protein CA984_34560 [Streptosporangium minutum]
MPALHKRFFSAILPPWARKIPRIIEVLPLLYLHGLSTEVLAVGHPASGRRLCPSGVKVKVSLNGPVP